MRGACGSVEGHTMSAMILNSPRSYSRSSIDHPLNACEDLTTLLDVFTNSLIDHKLQIETTIGICNRSSLNINFRMGIVNNVYTHTLRTASIHTQATLRVTCQRH